MNPSLALDGLAPEREPEAVRAAPQWTESALRLGGLTCSACVLPIEGALRAVDGVLQAHVSAVSACATVRWDRARTDEPALIRAIERAGYQAVPDTAAGARALRQREARTALWRLFVAGLCAMQNMMLATPSYVAGPGELAPDLKHLLDWGSWLLALPVMAFSASPFFRGAWRAWQNRRIGMDVPVALGIAVAFAGSSGATFDPGGLFGDAVYFDSLSMFVAFLLGGRLLEMQARHRAAVALEDTLAGLPETALRLRADGVVETVPVHQLLRGDVLRVPAGQTLAADGVLLEGSPAVDESLLSGESALVAKQPGDRLVAGSVNGHAALLMRVEGLGPDTRYEAIVSLMREAQTLRPASLASSERWAGPFLWAVLLVAGAAALAWQSIDPSRAVWVAVSVLIVTCPCALALAAPSALLAAAGAMGRQGLLLRRLDAIDGLAEAQLLCIDKTGTLTDPRLQTLRLQRLQADSRWDDAALLRIGASLAGWSSHPVAKALAAAAPGPAHGGCWHSPSEVPGKGLQALDAQGRAWRLGVAGWAGELHGQAATTLSVDGQALACFELQEQPRPGVVDCLRQLQQGGLKVLLLSGDDPARVGRFAASVGLSDWRGGMAPEDKLRVVREAQAAGQRVAMLGDGINDAPVLAQADVSVAMGEGAGVARSEADAVLVSNRLQDLASARALARKTQRVMRQNLAWALAYNAASVPLALMGWLPPWAAGLGMASSSLVVVFNALRLAR
ncbi:MAG TPA: cation-translocating P-type ATPase [Ideonella sp.]|uniref:heavy metal translocating P-type ATPase n=1 Tax=Ideonella sp. TaxID=1929293 RepID=UPI002B6EC98F|nr:cation-translocating P-type ATPase [Ideonella sp.]HSI49449.1 cation-translocating P-type ATPase [Ideonella sp.]